MSDAMEAVTVDVEGVVSNDFVHMGVELVNVSPLVKFNAKLVFFDRVSVDEDS